MSVEGWEQGSWAQSASFVPFVRVIIDILETSLPLVWGADLLKSLRLQDVKILTYF